MANSVVMLIFGRLIVGLAAGLTTSTLPMYMAELSPLQLRGTLAVLSPMGLTGGVVRVFQAIILELIQLRGSQLELINEELQSMENEAIVQSETRSLLSVIRDRKFLLPLILVCALLGGQQLSGLNAVFFYSVSMFERSGLSSTNAKWANLGTGVINFLVASFTPYLMATINRRPLLLFSIFATGTMLIMITVVTSLIDLASWLAYASIAFVFGFIVTLQLGLGPIPYFIGTELFESSSRPAAMSLGSMSLWAGNFIVAMAFPSLQEAWGAFVFLPFAVICFCLAVLIKFYLPETRNRDSSAVAPLVADGFKSRPLNR
ncbi:hypothetical protein HA402_011812 [Bradysia odoriphaga]|nr:hypothetical protein HA402_011812 [Bradysia odoriphaga]